MTALAGYWSTRGTTDAHHSCEQMLRAQQIYGPEAAALWTCGPLALGHRKHRSLPEDMHDRAPVVGAGGNLVLVADVRLDNRQELAVSLGIPSAEAKSLADSAILMKALERWDDDAIGRLVGDFAFALWDSRRKRVLLARDFLGQRPLHFHWHRSFFAFASMPKGLHALPEIPVAPDEQALQDFLALLPENDSFSFFESVQKVPPGHLAFVDADGVKIRNHWSPSSSPLLLKSPAEYEEALRHHLDRAVAERLRGSQNRVGAHLSGGLDSAAVTTTAARIMASTGGEVVAFTAAPAEDGEYGVEKDVFFDETGHAAASSKLHSNIVHLAIRSKRGSPLASLDRNFFLYERPYLNLCNGVWADEIRTAAKANRISVLLWAPMGNMTLSYNGMQLLPELLREGRAISWAREAIQLRRNGTRFGTIASQSFGPFMPRLLWSLVRALRGRGRRLSAYTLLCDEVAQDPAFLLRSAERGMDFSYRPPADAFSLRLRVMRGLDLGNYNKGALAGWGIDYRDPTADKRLVEFCLSVPNSQFLRNGVQRSLVRRALRDRLPPIVTEERRRGYQGPDWHEALTAARAELHQEVERISNCSGAERILETQRMKALVRNWPTACQDVRTLQQYRLGLLRGVSGGHFLRKAKGANQ